MNFDTAALSDALDRLGIEGQAQGIRPLAPTFSVYGRAFTVRFAPVSGRVGPLATLSMKSGPAPSSYWTTEADLTFRCGVICLPRQPFVERSPGL